MLRRRTISPFRRRERARKALDEAGAETGNEAGSEVGAGAMASADGVGKSSSKASPPSKTPRSAPSIDQPRHIPRLFWSDVVLDVVTSINAASVVIVIPTVARLRLWSLVLFARHVPHRLDLFSGGGGQRGHILVPSRFRSLAVAEIVAYERENPGADPELPPQVVTGGMQSAFWAMLALAAAYALTSGGLRLGGLHRVPWEELGMADSARMLAGEWWRAVTALTLHGDPAHLLSNVCLGAVFLVPLVRELGTGAGLLAALASGIFGNALNAFFHGPGHLSVGASTAVFGAVGVLGGLRAVRGEGAGLRRAFVPVAMGLAFLAFLGSGGGQTDLGAHLFGFLSGAFLGVFAGLCITRWGMAGRWLGGAFAMVAFALPVAAWGMALLS